MKINFYLLFGMIFLLTSCAVPSPPQINIFTISPEWQAHNKSLDEDKISRDILKLAPIRATQALTSTDLLYLKNSYVINSYAYSHWNDQPATLLETRFQISLEESGLFKAVIPPTSSSTAELLLESSLLDFSHHLKEGGASEGVCIIRFYLIDNLTKAIIDTKEFTVKITARSDDAQGAVKALNEATAVVSLELVDWLKEHSRVFAKAAGNK